MHVMEDISELKLSDLFKFVDDPRSKQGRIYPLPFILNCAQSAILCGASGFKQIGEWINAQPYPKLELMGNKYRRRPDESTIRKCLRKIEIYSFKDLCYKWSQAKESLIKETSDAIAVDGKTLRASRNFNNRQPHILSAITHNTGILVGDQLVPNKKSEVQNIMPLLDTIDITGKVVTADALHTISGFGLYLKSRDADYVFIAKGNKKKLIDRLRMMNIREVYDSYSKTEEKSHGRLETRKLFLTSTLPWWLWFKSAEQAFIIERTRINIKSGKIENESHFGLTSLSRRQADAARVLEIVRGHWTIENKAFHVRDRTYEEDQSTVKSGILPEIMVVFRNLALNLFRLKRVKNISEETRLCILHPGKELKYLGLK
jgi:predicted transposase YbfD/YdcC